RRLELSFNVEGNFKDKSIAPLLLLPLLENCFKHGVSEQIDVCWIASDLAVKDNTLFFKLTNSMTPGVVNTEDIGLRNVRKRLELLYPGSHHFAMHQNEESFTVSLELELDAVITSNLSMVENSYEV